MTGIDWKVFWRALSSLWDRGNRRRIGEDMAEWSLWHLPNLWESIQVMRTCIIKNNVPNPVSLVTRYPDYETIHCWLRHISDEAMRHISDNVEGSKKICFLNKKHIYYGCTLEKLHQCSFPENPKCSSETLGLIYSDLLELPTLSYSKCYENRVGLQLLSALVW